MKEFEARFDAIETPCYWLSASGGFGANEAARRAAGADALRHTEKQLRSIARAGAHTAVQATFLGARQVLVLPMEEGLLALENSGQDMPPELLSMRVREPVTDIFAVLPALANRLEDGDIQFIDSIRERCYELLRMSSNYELFAAPLGRLQADVLDAGSLAGSLAQAVQQVNRSGVPVSCEVAEPGLLVQGSRRALSAALLNLLRNSLQYTRDGNRVVLQVRRLGGQVVFTAEDRGLGIRPEVLPRIFEPYFSRDPYGDSQERPGLGLGLAVVRAVAEALGGTVAAESRFGEGTRITLALPLAGGGAGRGVLRSENADYLLNRYSEVYVQLQGICRYPDVL